MSLSFLKKYKKLSEFGIKRRNNSGIILIIVLWVLVILTLLAVSLGRNSQIELALAKHRMGEVQARYLAWAGFTYGLDQIHQDTEEEASNQIDTLYYCGVRKDDQMSTEEIFRSREFSEGVFKVEYRYQDEGVWDGTTFAGLQDEERFLNINGLNAQNYHILSSLIVLLGFDENIAETIGASVVDWRDEDRLVLKGTYGAEDDYYQSLKDPYRPKNLPFESTEELLFVRGMTEEIYERIKPYITVYPKTESFKVNFDTAPAIVLKALARSATGEETGAGIEAADALVEKMIEYRVGADKVPFSDDDRVVEIDALALVGGEDTIYFMINQYRTRVSNYLRVRAVGVERRFKTESTIEAVIQREDLSIISWKRT